MDSDQLCKKFVDTNKSLIIAPAGYGKTHTLAESLKYSSGKQLVLTHTHAGVAALKDKVEELKVPKSNYHIETISSFAQKYTKAFECGDIPDQKDSEGYYPFIIEKAKRLFKKKAIKDILTITYNGLFVDEYQDCTIQQHQMLVALSDTLPIHILGDPMQGIFGFGGQSLIDFDSDLSDFSVVGELETPWRWEEKNQELGASMHEARIQLESKSINLSCFDNSADILIVKDSKDITVSGTNYNKLIWKYIDSEDNLLLIYHDSTNINARIDLSKRFRQRLAIVEAIDDRSFYDYAERLDQLKESKDQYKDLVTCIKGVPMRGRNARSNTLLTNLNSFLKDDAPPTRSSDPQKVIAISVLNKCLEDFSFSNVAELLKILKDIPRVNCFRKELFWDIVKALAIASQEDISVLEAMEGIRNRKRSDGKKVYGKSIGTTLLTKGLEVDSVIVLNADEFTDAKNLYVALSRASNKLVIISRTEKIQFK